MGYGIDYGMGKTNIDQKTGIRFGVISANNVDYWYESSEPFTPENLSEEELEDFETQEYFVKDKEIFAVQSVSTNDIIVERSKYFTYASFCSPCCPGACNLTDFIEDDRPESNKCYCFGKDWFENEENIPYDIYEVSTGNLIFKKIQNDEENI